MILVYVITVAILAAAAVFYKRMDSKFKQEIADQKAVVAALQAHVEALSKKRDQLVRDLRNANSATAKKSTEFPVGTSVTETVAPVKKKKVYKRKPKAKVAE
jgi:23S rRNA maturation mini-RNase III